jgi:hypothetical protein
MDVEEVLGRLSLIDVTVIRGGRREQPRCGHIWNYSDPVGFRNWCSSINLQDSTEDRSGIWVITVAKMSNRSLG